MSITFKSNNATITQTLIIGGKDDSFAANEFGGYGPFPSYSISREEIFAGDGTYINSKYTININGTATIKPTESSSALQKGKRQSLVQGEQIIKLQFNRNKWPMIGDGLLKITPYGATTNEIKFYDARLISVNIPEQTEESAGIHSTQYAFVFEAYNIDGGALPSPLVSSIEENWELTENDGQYCFNNSDITSNNVFKTFTLTHTLSAVGIRGYNSTTTLNSEAWYQASEWVKQRLVNTPNETQISSHINNVILGPKFVPFYMNSALKKDDLKIDLIRDGVRYKAYNHSRNASVDISGAGYNLTDTWLIALESSKATHQIQTEVNNSSDASSISVAVSDTITGLNSETINSNKNNAYANAKTELDNILTTSRLFSIANSTYNGLSSFVRNGTLKNTIQSKTTGYNRTTGVITLSVTFNDENILSNATKVSNENITINYDNSDLSTEKIAIIPVIGRSAGPVIQRFTTNKERKTSVSIDLIIKPEYRTDTPPSDLGDSIADGYANNGYVNTRSESWNKKTGQYNLSIEWIYK